MDPKNYLAEAANDLAMEKYKDKGVDEAGMELSMIRKNLLNVFAKEEANLGVGEEHMKVFLRIRPLNTEDLGTKDDQGTLEMIDDHVVLAHAPPDSHAYRNKAHGRGRTTHKFTFSRVFPEPTTQKEFFDSTMLGFTRDFIDGQNCLVFTYGITSSGKTYTIQGTPNNAGLLPRTLDVLFNSIADRQWRAMDLKPHMFTDVERLSKEQEEAERKIKERVLRMRSDEAHDMNTLMGETEQSYLNTTSASDGSTSTDADHKDLMDVDLLKEVENRVRESTAVSVEDQGQIRFSIWVSFAEIYNEQIFDLLEPIPKKKNARRAVLKLSEDRNGSPYVKGLKEINVTSADEAYRLLTIGQSNLRIACTRLNHVSSRSHCIFNIKIVRVLDKENPHVARVSMLSLCDLAGSERYSKTLADNERLKEAGNINCSLHTLGRCIETLRYNQNHKENSRIIPFRDSKLTRLFQNFFNGRGKAAMVVNVNPCSSMFDETLQVFKFSAIAKQVVLHQAEPEPRPMLPPKPKTARAPTIAWEAPTPRTAKFRQSALEEASCMPLPDDDDDDLDEEEGEEKMTVCRTEIEELVNENDQLRQMLLDEKREKVFLEMKIRDEVVKEMSAQFVEIENRWRERNRETEELAEERAEKRVQMYMEAVSARKARKRRRGEGDEEAEEDLIPSALLQAERTRIQDRDRRIQELETELSVREQRMTSLEGSLAAVRKQCEELTRDKTALEFQCADSRRRKSSEASSQNSDEALASLKQENEKLQSQIAELEEKIKAQGGDRDLDVLSQQQLLEAMGTKLSEAKAANKEQAEEIEALNEMLNEAGETFQQQRTKIETLEAALQERDAKILEQAELIRSLQQLVSESKAAMEESDQRLTARQQRIGSLEAEVNTQREELVRLRALAGERPSLSALEEEVANLQVKLHREEVESRQRENALIHGYTSTLDQLEATVKAKDLELARLQVDSERVRTLEQEKKELREKITRLEKEDKNFLLKKLGEKSKALDKGDKKAASAATAKEDQEVGRLQADLSRLEEKVQMLEKEKSEMEGRLDAVKKDKEAQGQLLSKRAAALEVTLAEAARLRDRVADLEDRCSELEQQCEELQVVKHELQTMLDSATAGSTNHQQQQKEKLAVAKAEVSRTCAALEALKKEMADQSTKTADLASQLETKTAEYTALQTECAELQTQLQRQAAQLEETQRAKTESVATKAPSKGAECQSKAGESSSSAQVERLQREVEALKEEVEGLEEDVRDKDGRLHRLREELAVAKRELRQQGKTTTPSVEAVTTELASLQQEKTELEAKVKEVESQRASAEAKVAELKSQLSAAEADLSSLKQNSAGLQSLQEQICDLQATKGHLEAATGDLEAKVTQLEADLSEKSAALDQASSDFAAKMAALEEQAAKSTRDLESLKTASKNKVCALEDRLAEQDAKAEERTADLEGALARASARLEEERSSLQGRVKALEEEVSRLTSRLHSKEQELETARVEMKKKGEEAAKAAQSQLELQLAEVRSSLLQEKSLHTNCQAELDHTKTQLTELEEKIQHLRSAKGDHEAQLGSVLEEKASLEERLTTAEARLRTAESELTASQAFNLALEQNVSQLRFAEKGLKSELDKAKADKKELEALNKELKSSQDKSANDLRDARAKVKALEEEVGRLETELKQTMGEMQQQKTSESDLQSQHKSTSSKLDKAQAEVDRLETTVKDLTKQLHTVSEEKENWGRERKNLQESLEKSAILKEANRKDLNARHELEAKLQQETAAVKKSQETIEDLRKQLEEQNKFLSKALQDLAGSREKCEKQAQDIQTLQHRLDELTKQEAKAEELRQKVAELECNRETALRSEVKQGAASGGGEASSLGGEAALLDLKGKLVDVRLERDRLRAEIRELKRKVDSSGSHEEELTKSQQRERTLRQQLQQAGDSMLDHSARIAQLEQQLQKAQADNDALRAKMAAKERTTGQEVETGLKELKEQVKELQEELERRDKLLEASHLSIQELQRSLQQEQEKLRLATKDTKAMEGMVDMLKTALTEQEETMATQDSVLQARDQEISTLTNQLELVTEQYKASLGERGESGREMREMSRTQARLGGEVEKLRSTVLTLTAERDALSAQLAQQSETSDASKTETDQLLEQIAKLTKDRDSLNSALQDNNQEVRSLEKALSERTLELEKLKQAADDAVKKNLDEKKKETDSTIEDLKKKIMEKDSQIRKLERELRGKEEEISKLEQRDKERTAEMEAWRKERDGLVEGLEKLMRKQQAEIKQLREEKASTGSMKELQAQLEEKEGKIGNLQSQVQNLELLLSEGGINTPRRRPRHEPPHSTPSAPDLETLITQLESEKTEKREVRQKMRSVQKAKDMVISDLRKANGQLQVQLAKIQGVQAPVITSPVPSFQEEEDSLDTSSHLHIDVTPAVAAKALRKSRKRNSSSADVSLDRSQSKRKTTRTAAKVKEEPMEQDESASLQMSTIEEEERGRRPSRRAKSTAKGKIETLMSAIQNSPFTRSARKLMEAKEGSADSEASKSKKGKQRKTLYNPDAPPVEPTTSPPFNCAPYEPPEDRKNVHNIVMRKLRTRQSMRKETDL